MFANFLFIKFTEKDFFASQKPQTTSYESLCFNKHKANYKYCDYV